VIGHFAYGIHTSLPRAVEYVTVLRDPVERTISQYFHFVRAVPELISNSNGVLSFADAMESRRYADLDNVMVRKLAGADDLPVGAVDRSAFDLALHNLRNGFVHIGFQHNADASLEFLSRRYGWKDKTPLARENPGNYRLDEAELANARTFIEHFNKWDVLLYKEASR
jgi:hypothetical protein